MKTIGRKAISLIALLALLVSTALPLTALAANVPKAGNIQLATGTSTAFKSALTYNIAINGAGEYNLAINDAFVTMSGNPLSYLIVEFVPHNIGDQISAAVDRKDGNGFSDLLANGTAHFNAAFYPTTTEFTQPSVISGSGGRFSTAVNGQSIANFDLRINVKSANGTDYDVNYIIHITRSAAETIKVLDAAVSAQTTETDKLDWAGQYFNSFKKLSYENREKVTNKLYYGSEIAVKTGTTGLNIDYAVVNAYYPAVGNASAVPGTGSIDLPIGSSTFQIANIDGVSQNISYSVSGGTSIAAGTNASAKPANGTVITVVNGTKSYNLTVNYTDAAEVSYLKRVLTQFYAPENIDSISALNFAYVPRYSARSTTEKAELDALEATLLNDVVTGYRTANKIPEGILTALKARYAALPSASKTAVTASNVTYLNSAVPYVEPTESSSSASTSSNTSSNTSSTSTTKSPQTGDALPFTAGILLILSAIIAAFVISKRHIGVKS